MRKLLPAIVLLLAAASAFAAQPHAAPTAKQAAAQKQLEQMRARIKTLAEEQRQLEDQRGQATQSLREVDGKVSGAQRALQKTQEQIAGQEQELARLQQQRQDVQDGLLKQRDELAALVRSAYALGRHGQLKLLLEQERMSDLARVLAYHGYFQRDRQQRISGLDAQLQTLAQLAEQIRTQQQELVAARDRQQGELAALASQRKERGKIVSSLDERYRDRSARLSALGRDEKNTVALLERLRKLMEQMPKPSVAPRTPGKPGDAAIPAGPLNLPLTGTVLAGYGGVMPDGHRSQGLLIAGTPGAQVRAVSDGRVAYADWLKGYGLLIILDHGNGWMTLYAFNDALLKNTGASVRAGEPISTVGSSGGQGRSALYFELRHNGQPRDPSTWLKK